MTDQQPPTEPEPQTEKWIFGGYRVGQGGKRLHAWVDPAGQQLGFKASGRFVVGSVYAARVTRAGDTVSLYGRPAYTGDRCNDDALLDELSARHRAAETALTLAARQRADKRRDPVEQAIDRLAELAAHVPASQRTGFAIYVTVRLLRTWR
jgi:hypothetical protein